MAYLNDLTEEIEREASPGHSPELAAPKLLDLVHRLLSERHAYRCVLEPVAYGRCTDLAVIQSRAKDVCGEFVTEA